MIVQIVVFISAIATFLIGYYLRKKESALTAFLSKQQNPTAFFRHWGNGFWGLAAIAIIAGVINQTFLILIYLLLLFLISAGFGISFAKKMQ